MNDTDLRDHEEALRDRMSRLLLDSVKHGILTFDDIGVMLSNVVALSRTGIRGSHIGARLRGMAFDPAAHDAEVVEIMGMLWPENAIQSPTDSH